MSCPPNCIYCGPYDNEAELEKVINMTTEEFHDFLKRGDDSQQLLLDMHSKLKTQKEKLAYYGLG